MPLSVLRCTGQPPKESSGSTVSSAEGEELREVGNAPLRPGTWNPGRPGGGAPWVRSAVGLRKCLPTRSRLAASRSSLALPCPTSASRESRPALPSPHVPGGHRGVSSLLAGPRLPPPTSVFPLRSLRKVSGIPWFLPREGEPRIHGRPFLGLPQRAACRLSCPAYLKARIQRRKGPHVGPSLRGTPAVTSYALGFWETTVTSRSPKVREWSSPGPCEQSQARRRPAELKTARRRKRRNPRRSKKKDFLPEPAVPGESSRSVISWYLIGAPCQGLSG